VLAGDGETIVLGGMIQTSDNKTENRVPWFGDLPGIGALFRYRTQDRRKTELLVIMTPHVVRCPADAEYIWQAESKKMDWTLANVVKLQGTAPPPGQLPAPTWERHILGSTNLPPLIVSPPPPASSSPPASAPPMLPPDNVPPTPPATLPPLSPGQVKSGPGPVEPAPVTPGSVTPASFAPGQAGSGSAPLGPAPTTNGYGAPARLPGAASATPPAAILPIHQPPVPTSTGPMGAAFAVPPPP